MEILLGTQGLSEPLPYLATVFEHLERLGHEVLVFTAEAGPPADGLRVVSAERGLPLAPDVIYAQDAYAALLLADLYPLTPQVFALHDDRDELWLPPQLPAVIARVVVFDDRGGDRARAASLVHEIVRLRRPVDTDRFSPRAPLRDRPQAALLQLGHLSDYRRGIVERACADAGIETADDADLAIGRGLPILEAMASGRAAYVYGEDGGDGWVTPERYDLLEGDGFSGRAEPTATDFERLRRDIDAYDPAKLGSVDFFLILNRNDNIIPAVARLTREQAAAYFMLGETRGTSAGGADEAGKALRVPGTNPFFPLPHAYQGNRFMELALQHPMEVFLLNTGSVGGAQGTPQSSKVGIPHSSAIVKGIAEGTITWQRDPDFGYAVATFVPDISEEDRDLLQPRRRYEATGRIEEYRQIVRRLKSEREAFLKGFSGLDSRLLQAVL